MINKKAAGPITGVFAAVLMLAACAQTAPPVERNFISAAEPPRMDMKVAILGFDNWTSHPSAGQIIAQLLASELYSQGVFEISEVAGAGDGSDSSNASGGSADLVAARKKAVLLNVDAVIVGSVSEYGYKHSLNEEPAVGLSLRLVSAQTGEVIWAASHSVIGTDKQQESVNQAAQRAIGLVVQGLLNGLPG